MITHNILFEYKNENYPKLSQICSNAIFPKGLKNEFETAVVIEPSMFEPLKVYCIADFHTWPQGYKTFFIFNSTEHEILNCWHFNIYELEKVRAQLS